MGRLPPQTLPFRIPQQGPPPGRGYAVTWSAGGVCVRASGLTVAGSRELTRSGGGGVDRRQARLGVLWAAGWTDRSRTPPAGPDR